MKSRTCKYVSAQRKHCLCCILKGVKHCDLSLDAALDFFYHSQVYQLIRDGVSDMHCMSNAYLAEELKQEYAEKVPVNEVVKERIK